MKKFMYVSLLLLAVFGLTGCTQKTTEESSLIEIQEVPTRRAEINGVVKSIVGNEMIVGNEIGGEELLSDEEREAKKASNQALTPEERQAARDELKAEIETEIVTVTVPVGVRIVKASGTGDGSVVDTDLASLKAGDYVSVWMIDDEVEIMKVKGAN